MTNTSLDSARARLDELTKRMKEDLGQVSEEEEEASMDDVKMEDTLETQEQVESGMKVSERYNEDNADLTLVSSDGVMFKVHSFALLRNSSVFDSMVSIAQSNSQRDIIHLTDQFVEHSQVIKATLDILYHREITSFRNERLYQHVIEFARKWEIPVVLKTISKELRLQANYPKAFKLIIRMFRLAINLGEHDVIIAVIKAWSGKSWGTNTSSSTSTNKPDHSFFPPSTPTLPEPTIEGALLKYIEGAPIFELGGWPFATFAELPLPLIWAILRAGQLAKGRHTDAMATELKKVLDLMYPNTSTSSGEGSAAPPA